MNTMGRTLWLAVSLCLISAAAGAQIVNPGFESWTNGAPDGWYSYLSIFNDISKSSTAHSGSASLKASVVLVANVPTGSFILGGTAGQGFPVDKRYTSVSGYYQFNSVGGDHLLATAVMYAGATGSTTAIGAGQFDTPTGTGAWTKFTIPITYITTAVPQSIIIQMVIGPNTSGSTVNVGSYYLVDDLSLDLTTAVPDTRTTHPAVYALEQNFPNPFNPATTVRFSIPKESHVVLTVYNILGEEIKTMVNDVRGPGSYHVTWNGDDNAGHHVGSGLYFYRLQAGDFSQMKRMVLLK